MRQPQHAAPTPKPTPPSPGNLLSFIAFIIGSGLLVWLIEHYQDWGGLTALSVQLTLLAAITLMICGVTWQTRYSTPLFEWRLFLYPKATLVMFMTLLLGTIVYGLIYLIPLYTVTVHHAGPSTVFAVVAAAAIPQVLMYPLFMKYKRYLVPHLSVACGFFILGAMSLYFSMTGVDFGPNEMWKIQLARAIGILTLAIPFNAVLLQSTPAGLEMGMGVQYNFLRTLGGALSIAAINAYVTQRASTYTQDAQAYGPSTQTTGDAPNFALAVAFNDAFTALSMLLLIAGLLALLLRSGRNVTPS